MIQTHINELKIGSRVEIYEETSTSIGILEEVNDAGVVISWLILEWQVVNGEPKETLMRKHLFVPFEEIKSYSWITV